MSDTDISESPSSTKEAKDILLAYYSRAVNELGQDKAVGELDTTTILLLSLLPVGAFCHHFPIGVNRQLQQLLFPLLFWAHSRYTDFLLTAA